MTRKMAVKASLFTLIVAFAVFGTLTVKAVMTGEKSNKNTKSTAENAVAEVEKWYSLTVGNESDFSTWEIGSLTTPPATNPGPGCSEANTGAHCSILLKFDPTEVDSLDLQNQSLADIQAEYGSQVEDIEEARMPINP